jgi:Flp pilus assembly protein TadD
MKMIKRVAMSITALVFIGSSVFAQSLADAKKAIDAEQYQKAKTMLKNLTVTQPTNDENFFYLGWVYIKQDYTDSAKTSFNKGIAVNPKSALNYVGLGAVARLEKDKAGATSDFNQALTLAGKDTKPYRFVGESYLLPVPPATVVAQADADAAIAVLEKGKVVNPKVKDAELMVALGDAYISQMKSNDAYKNYSDALGTDPKSVTANVKEGVLWRFANNWESAANQFKAALAIDPNFGPAYREWAETDLRQSKNDPKNASEKVKEAVEYYRKYLSLTDMSLESQLRYADFLYNAGEFKTLQETTAALSKYANSNLRVYRYLAYSALENKDYPAGLSAINKWLSQAGPNRIYPTDYLVQGRLQLASGDSTGIANLRKAYALDTTKADVFLEIAKSDQAKKKWLDAASDYQEYFDKSHKGALLDHYWQGVAYYYGYFSPAGKNDSTILIKADSSFSYVNKKAAAPVALAVIYRARINDLKDADRNNIKGLGRPFYEQYISLVGSKATQTQAEKEGLAESYAYLANIYEFKDKDDAKTLEAYTKAKEYDPTNKQVIAYFSRKPGAKSAK